MPPNRKIGAFMRAIAFALIFRVLCGLCFAQGGQAKGAEAGSGRSPNTQPLAQASTMPLAEFKIREALVDRFNGSALVKRRNVILLREGFGSANIQLHIANAPTTRFRLGSLSKQFTAAAVLKLADQGKLKLTASVCSYLDNCPPAWAPIQIKHLLQHSSGIPNFTDLPTYAALKQQHVNSAMLVQMFEPLPLRFAPGSKFEYSNSGYVLLGYLVERITGEDLGSYMARTFFGPLSMTNTGYDRQTAAESAHAATGYARNPLGQLVPAGYIDMTVPQGAGGFYSTVDDLAKWLTALFSDQVISTSSRIAMFTPGLGNYGFGWFVMKTSAGQTAIFHTGIIDGFASSILIDAGSNTQVILLSNVEGTQTEAIANALMILALE
jgi:CubicO group peptidase (beta-lactamase class C family)